MSTQLERRLTVNLVSGSSRLMERTLRFLGEKGVRFPTLKNLEGLDFLTALSRSTPFLTPAASTNRSNSTRRLFFASASGNESTAEDLSADGLIIVSLIMEYRGLLM